MEWIDQLTKSLEESFFNGLIGILFLLVIGVALYYITGDNHPYRERGKPVIIRGPKNKALPIKNITQIEGSYKITEISREPLEEERRVE
jgi:hypothetical protein